MSSARLQNTKLKIQNLIGFLHATNKQWEIGTLKCHLLTHQKYEILRDKFSKIQVKPVHGELQIIAEKS